MSLWNRLLNCIRKSSPNSRPPEMQKAGTSSPSPAAQLPQVAPLNAGQMSAALESWRQQHAFIQAEIDAEWERTQDQLHQRKQAYLRTLHPFLRYYVPLFTLKRVVETEEFSVSGEEKHKLEMDYYTALSYFRQLMEPPTPQGLAYRKKIKSEMSPEGLALVERYRSDAALLVKKADEVHRRYHKHIPACYRWEITRKVTDAFWEKYGSPKLKYQAAYELARRGQADDFLPAPFRLLGYMGPDWDQGGMVFAIDRECFADPDPLLCYWQREKPEIDWTQAREEPYVPAEDAYEYEQQMFGQFCALSSGIVPLRIQGHFFFRLDERAVKACFPNFGEDLPTAEMSPYLFVKCGSRDFHAHFGQVVDGQIVQLYEKRI